MYMYQDYAVLGNGPPSCCLSFLINTSQFELIFQNHWANYNKTCYDVVSIGGENSKESLNVQGAKQ